MKISEVITKTPYSLELDEEKTKKEQSYNHKRYPSLYNKEGRIMNKLSQEVWLDFMDANDKFEKIKKSQKEQIDLFNSMIESRQREISNALFNLIHKLNCSQIKKELQLKYEESI